MWVWPVLLLLGTVCLTAFWDEIREWALSTASNWARLLFGVTAERWLREAVVLLDKVVVAGRRMVRQVLGVRGRDGRVRHVTTEEIPFDDLPDEVQADLRQGPVEQGWELWT